MKPVHLSRLPDGAAAPKKRRPRRTRAEMRADLERAIDQAKTPLELALKTRALERMDREAA